MLFQVNSGVVSYATQLYDYLRGPYADLVYPELTPYSTLENVSFLAFPERLYISGWSREISSIRIRQLRGLPEPCNVMAFLEDVDGYPIECHGEFDKYPDENDMFTVGDERYRAIGDFRRPFQWQDVEDLDTSSYTKMKGKFGTYPQTGFALDAIVNVSPVQLGVAVQDCEDFLQESVDECAREQQVPIVAPYKTSNGELGCGPNVRQISAVAYDPSLDLERCYLLPDPPTGCTISGYMPLATLVTLSQPDRCGSCPCRPVTDPFCNTSCSPKNVFYELIDRLEAGQWMDYGTRAVIIDTPLFNQESNLFTNVRQLAEFPGFAKMQTRYAITVVDTVKLFRYVTSGDAITLGLEIALIVFALYYTADEILEMRALGFGAYCSLAWNYVDWANLGILYAVFLLRLLAYAAVGSVSFQSVQLTYIDFPTLVAWSLSEVNLNAFNFFLIYFKVFKFLANIPRMDAILVTVSTALFDLTLFMIMAVIVQFGFCAAWVLILGPYLTEFTTMGSALSVNIQILLGEFSGYGRWKAIAPLMTPLLFYLYISFVFFILLNMFLAIINDAYAEVKANQSEDDLKYYVHLKDRVVDRLNVMLGRKRAINRLAQELLREGADRNDDGQIDMDELREILQHNPDAVRILEVMTVEELMAKYDVDNDGTLSRAEVRAIVAELAEKEANETEKIRMEQAERNQGRQMRRGRDVDENGLAVERGGTAARRGRLGPQMPRRSQLGRRQSIGGGSQGSGGSLRGGTHRGPRSFAGSQAGDFLGGGGLDANAQARLDAVDASVQDLSRNVAKKMALMIELMMSLSDQVGEKGGGGVINSGAGGEADRSAGSPVGAPRN